MNTLPRVVDTISPAAWRLAEVLIDNPQAASGSPAAVAQATLLPVFAGDEDLLSAAFDELLVVPLRLGAEDEPWADFHILAAARFEPLEEMVLVHYQFHRDFLRLVAIAARKREMNSSTR